MIAAGDKPPIRWRYHSWWCAITLLAVLCATSCRDSHRGAGARTQRYVSLSPAITETLFALGVGSSVVGVSDYCHYPAKVAGLPHLGSGYTPRYEAIVGLAPTTIFLDGANAETSRELNRVTHVELMSWLTLEQVVASTHALGQLVGATTVADQLAQAYEISMRPKVSAKSPRVLLVLAHTPGQLREAWFIRRNSIHGRVLEAAGARNAAPDETNAPPRLSLEQVVRLNPDGIIILHSAASSDERLLDDWRRLNVLAAVKSGRIQEIAALDVMITGPRIVDLVRRLSPWIDAWSKLP